MGMEDNIAARDTDARWRSDGPRSMNTDLTDAEWALVHDLSERDGRRGVPPRFERRLIVNARRYTLLTSSALRRRPKSFPPWRAVYMAFKRWDAASLFEATRSIVLAASAKSARSKGLPRHGLGRSAADDDECPFTTSRQISRQASKPRPNHRNVTVTGVRPGTPS